MTDHAKGIITLAKKGLYKEIEINIRDHRKIDRGIQNP